MTVQNDKQRIAADGESEPTEDTEELTFSVADAETLLSGGHVVSEDYGELETFLGALRVLPGRLGSVQPKRQLVALMSGQADGGGDDIAVGDGGAATTPRRDDGHSRFQREAASPSPAAATVSATDVAADIPLAINAAPAAPPEEDRAISSPPMAGSPEANVAPTSPGNRSRTITLVAAALAAAIAVFAITQSSGSRGGDEIVALEGVSGRQLDEADYATALERAIDMPERIPEVVLNGSLDPGNPDASPAGVIVSEVDGTQLSGSTFNTDQSLGEDNPTTSGASTPVPAQPGGGDGSSTSRSSRGDSRSGGGGPLPADPTPTAEEATPTATVVPTATPVPNTATPVPSPTPRPTATPTPTATATATSSPTPTSTPTSTPTATATPSPTPTPTATPTTAATATAVPTSRPTVTPPASVGIARPTNTPAPPTATPIPSPTPTATNTPVPSPTPTSTNTPTPTPTGGRGDSVGAGGAPAAEQRRAQTGQDAPAGSQRANPTPTPILGD